MSRWRKVGGKGRMLPDSRKMMPRLSDMHGVKRSQFKLYRGGKKKRKTTLGRMIRGM